MVEPVRLARMVMVCGLLSRLGSLEVGLPSPPRRGGEGLGMRGLTLVVRGDDSENAFRVQLAGLWNPTASW
ncbi:hypothetical protein Poly41_19690 [Novipirellula artificiosorum]|uniref:Uncharacterized protein n=1 Tax=Novipirellula artificiosorum TaxID=2528016 RepID=A0A5C6E0A5_9BACT|nr:hypothetical protein Poly41_19690 [Novipirellula artificiosorum]